MPAHRLGERFALVIAFSCAAATKHLYSVVSDCMLPVTLEKLCDKTTEAEKIEPEEPLFHNVLHSSCICQKASSGGVWLLVRNLQARVCLLW